MVNSLILAGLSTLLVFAVTVPTRLYEAARRRRRGAHLANIVSMALYSIPPFLLGTLLIHVACDRPELARTHDRAGLVDRRCARRSRGADHSRAHPLRRGRSRCSVATCGQSTMEELTQEYITTARAKGASRSRVSLRHALPNASLPIITLLGTRLPQIFGAQLVVEVLFAYPGLGTTLWNAANRSRLLHDARARS